MAAPLYWVRFRILIRRIKSRLVKGILGNKEVFDVFPSARGDAVIGNAALFPFVGVNGKRMEFGCVIKEIGAVNNKRENYEYFFVIADFLFERWIACCVLF